MEVQCRGSYTGPPPTQTVGLLPKRDCSLENRQPSSALLPAWDKLATHPRLFYVPGWPHQVSQTAHLPHLPLLSCAMPTWLLAGCLSLCLLDMLPALADPKGLKWPTPGHCWVAQGVHQILVSLINKTNQQQHPSRTEMFYLLQLPPVIFYMNKAEKLYPCMVGYSIHMNRFQQPQRRKPCITKHAYTKVKLV